MATTPNQVLLCRLSHLIATLNIIVIDQGDKWKSRLHIFSLIIWRARLGMVAHISLPYLLRPTLLLEGG